MTSMITTIIIPRPDRVVLPLAVTAGVPVGGGVMDGIGEGVDIAVGLGVRVGVTGGARSSTNFCSGRITEVASNPFQDIRSEREMPYRPAIHESVSPLRTV